MITSIIYLILAGGVPYYLLLEKSSWFKHKHIFLTSMLLLLGASISTWYIPHQHSDTLVIISLASAIFSIYKATKTTNFYRLGYYLIFINAPFFLLFEDQYATYSLSLIASLTGLYLIAHFYEKNYGSANYHYITGITLIRPYIGTFLTLYLIAIALYPPFPNALFFLSHIITSKPDLLWYCVVTTLFFGNFFLAMRVMTKTLFGRPNANIHYVHMTLKDKAIHFCIFLMLLLLSIIGLKETLS